MYNITKAQHKLKRKNHPLVLANMELIGKLARTISSENWGQKLTAVD